VAAPSENYGAARTIAHLQDANVTESSGVVASRVNPGVYWTHNDSGDGPMLYAFDRNGRSYGRWRVRRARAVDWEDIAIGPGPKRGRPYLYVGDIGDNARNRREVVVYRIEELRTSSCKSGCSTGAATTSRLRYPNGPNNAEALLVHPATGDLYIVSKAPSADPRIGVYRARGPLVAGRPVTMTQVCPRCMRPELCSPAAGGAVISTARQRSRAHARRHHRIINFY
jgi:hypothetical protein